MQCIAYLCTCRMIRKRKRVKLSAKEITALGRRQRTRIPKLPLNLQQSVKENYARYRRKMIQKALPQHWKLLSFVCERNAQKQRREWTVRCDREKKCK
jgi:hypothetical protein